MARVINALQKGELQRGLAQVRKDINTLNAELTGANSEPVRKSAAVLLKAWRKVVGIPGHGEPSVPGQPPREQTRKLRRSLRTAVVDGVRRVGSGWFVARLLEYGVQATWSAQSRGQRLSSGRRARTSRAAGSRVIAPRPHGRVALALAEKEMVDVQVSEMQKKVARGA